MSPMSNLFTGSSTGSLPSLTASKAIAINHGCARYHSDICYLRYDNTNPAKEQGKYFTAISEIIQ
ncbi:hypothetical protein BJY01DRAFT_108846 [Aspergillus pseudoustus]|uniref:Glutamyl/glutaminyl-tRNA synthetase class Ib catalytic domain-containing protein n=1 Tax=Aspergillus pseudoustus TaxID=1810923 RepID=A0ABR4IUF7_9EURO